MVAVILALAVAAFLFWLYELWAVATMSDSDFPGRNDKLIWVIIVLFASVIGAVLFVLWQIEQNVQHSSNARLKRAADRILRQEQDGDQAREKPTPS